MAHMLSPSWHFHKRVKWKTCQSVLTFSLLLKIVKFHTKCKTWQASHPANFKSDKFIPYPWNLVAYKCKKSCIDLFMGALVSQLLFLLLCKQWFISFFCICGIDIFDFICSSQKVKKNCQSLWACLSMCLHGSISKCLSCACVQSVKTIKCVSFPSASPPKGALPSYNASILLLQ